ncbi:MAG: LPS export ABC transporter periplasmic protein LptC [Hyphomicrobium sp.]
MASTSDFQRPPQGERTGERTVGRGITVELDRTHSFRAAKRHSTMVRTLRVALPVMSVTILGVYGLSLLKLSDLTDRLPEVSIPDILPENLTMDNPHYEGFGKDGSSYEINARTAQQDLRNTSIIKLDAISGTLVDAERKKTVLEAARGVFNHTENVLELEQSIEIKSQTGMAAKLTQATVTAKEGLITSRQPVAVSFTGGTVTANALSLRHKTREVTFIDAVKARLQPPAKPPEAVTGARTERAENPASPLAFAASGDPVEITAQRLDINDERKTALFTGDVTAVQGTAALATPELLVSYEGDTAAAVGASPSSAGPLAGAGNGKVSRITAKGPVTMTRGASDRVTSDAAEFDAKASTAVLTGNVVMTSGVDRRVVSDRADLDSGADTALLTGAVVVTSGKNELKGRRLWIDRKAEKMQMTAPGGRIFARFTQDQSKARKSAKPAAAAPAAGFATFKTDPNAPVEIEADQLDADDAAKTAMFRGAVKATQGGFVIRTPELLATYSGEAGLGEVAATDAKPADSKPAAQLTRIDAKKKVVVTSGDGQTVNGDWAIFDTATDTVTVGGDVMLSQGKNVVRGTRLVIDMTTGQSTIDTSADATVARAAGGWATSAPGGPGGTPSQGRPSAVFYPDQLEALRGKDSGADGGKGKDAWTPSTRPAPQAGQRGN